MSNPTIQDAKNIAMKHCARGVAILAFANGQYSMASYGHTRADCVAMRYVVEQIADMIGVGDIEVLPVLGKAARGEVACDDGAEDVNAELLAACQRALHLVEENNEAIVEMVGSFGLLADLQAAIAKATKES